MEKIFEDFLWENIHEPVYPLEHSHQKIRFFPRDVIKIMIKKKMINSPKQAWRTLEKWGSKDLYDYGCKLDLGWKESK